MISSKNLHARDQNCEVWLVGCVFGWHHLYRQYCLPCLMLKFKLTYVNLLQIFDATSFLYKFLVKDSCTCVMSMRDVFCNLPATFFGGREQGNFLRSKNNFFGVAAAYITMHDISLNDSFWFLKWLLLDFWSKKNKFGGNCPQFPHRYVLVFIVLRTYISNV